MSSSVTNLLTGYFSEELIDERADMRSSLHHAGPEGVELVRSQFQDFLRSRGMSRDEFWTATSAWFDSEDEMYAQIEDAYRFFFDEEPPPAA